MFEALFSPIILRGLKLKNRVVFAPTSMGLTPDAMYAHIETISRGGAGLIILGDVPVLPTPFGSFYDEKSIQYYHNLVKIAHNNGSAIAVQLHMTDTNTDKVHSLLPELKAGKITPQELRDRVNAMIPDFIMNLSTAKIDEIINGFGITAARAYDIGFDLIQVHGDRMCGSFSSTLLNHRTDCYGGTPQNRAKFAVRCLHAVRNAIPDDMPIEFKLVVRIEHPRHYGNAGILLEELPIFLPLLDQAGADSYEVALANHSRLIDTIPPANHQAFGGPGCFLPLCDIVHKFTDRPLCAVGGMGDPNFCNEQIAKGRIQYVALSRPLLADPFWPKLAQQGRTREIIHCIRCNRDCLGGMQRHEGTHCIFDAKRAVRDKSLT